MHLDTIKDALYGLVCGLTEILPVSAQAHSIVLLKLFGGESRDGLPNLLIHLAIGLAIYHSTRKNIIRMLRAKRLSQIPKRRRKRPLDAKSLMDYKFWMTMCIPVAILFLLYGYLSKITITLPVMAALLFVNGALLYAPQFFPGSNKDSRMLSRMEGLLMGLGGALSVIPGLSGVGLSLSAGSLLGVEKSYALTMTLLMDLAALVGWGIYDVAALISGGIGALSVSILLGYILAAAAAYAGTALAIRALRLLSGSAGYGVFAYYCWGMALFAFILNLMA